MPALNVFVQIYMNKKNTKFTKGKIFLSFSEAM